MELDIFFGFRAYLNVVLHSVNLDQVFLFLGSDHKSCGVLFQACTKVCNRLCSGHVFGRLRGLSSRQYSCSHVLFEQLSTDPFFLLYRFCYWEQYWIFRSFLTLYSNTPYCVPFDLFERLFQLKLHAFSAYIDPWSILILINGG